jgi:outer membrane lipoprotein carrier protein
MAGAILVPVLAAVLLGAADQPPAAEPAPLSACARSAIDAVQRRYESVRDLSASFEQTSRSATLGPAAAPTRAAGQVIFAKPGRMRWSYSEPEKSLMVSDGKWLWIYDPGRREAQKLPVGDAWLSGAGIQFLLGDGQILREFRVASDACTGSEAQLTLAPLEPAPYEEVRLTADRVSGDVRATEVVDLLGNVTKVSFRDTRINQNPKPDLFRFEPPPGVSVMELEAPAPSP